MSHSGEISPLGFPEIGFPPRTFYPPALSHISNHSKNPPELPRSDPASPTAMHPLPDNLPELPRSDPTLLIAMFALPDNLPDLPQSDPASPIAMYLVSDNLPQLPRSDPASPIAINHNYQGSDSLGIPKPTKK